MKKNSHDGVIISGGHVNLREIRIEDAEFILKLRTSEKGLKFLHYTENNLDRQISYLQQYFTKDDEWYFIVETKEYESIGCLSIYDIKGDSVCTGRWIMKEGIPFQQSIEADMLLKEFAFSELGAAEIRMDTRHENKNMQAYFRMWGCKEVSKDEELIYVVLPRDVYVINRARVARFCC